MSISKFMMDVIADYVRSGRVRFHKAKEIVAEYGVELRREPMGLTFWNKDGRRLHGVFNFNQPGEID